VAIVKSLTILLRGNTSKLKSDFKPAKQAVSGLQKQFSATFTNVGLKIAGLAGAIVGVTSLAGAMMKLNTQFSKLDDLAKSADKIGATVGEMQALELAAKLSGTELAAAETAMLKLSQTLGKAISGDSAAVKALESIGLTVADFENLNPNEAFGKVSDAINQLGSQAEQTAAIMSIFGRGGTEVFNLIKGGSATINQATADIQSFGLELNRVDAAKIEMANDAWTKMQMMIDGLFQQIAVALAPAFTALIETIIELTKNSGVMGSVATTSLDLIIAGVDIASRSFSFMAGVVRSVQTAFATVLSFILKGLAQIEKALIMFGGQSFDFGIATLAKAADEVAADLGKKAGENFSQAFGKNDFSEKFKSKLAEIESRATEIAENVDKKAFARPLTPEVEIKEDNIKLDKVDLNVASATGGSQEAFATIFGQQQRPMEAIVQATQQGNQILTQISNKLDRNQMPQLAIAGDVFP
jgi:hypothetical protein